MLKGRLGLETARIPQVDRHGVMWLGRGNLLVEDGTLRFVAAGDGSLAPGEYLIPFQTISCLLLGPGTHQGLTPCQIGVIGTEGHTGVHAHPAFAGKDHSSPMVAIAVAGALPQLGFIHEHSGISFCLDLADLYRHSVTLPVAFGAVRDFQSARPRQQFLTRSVGPQAGRQDLPPRKAGVDHD